MGKTGGKRGKTSRVASKTDGKDAKALQNWEEMHELMQPKATGTWMSVYDATELEK